MDSPVQVAQSRLQVASIFLPCHPVHPRCRPLLQLVVAPPELIDSHMMQQGCEPQLPISFRGSTHTVQPAGPAFPTRGSARVRLFRVLLGQRSSLHILRRQLPALVRMFAGTTALYDSLSPCMWGLSLIAFPHRHTIFRPRVATGPLGPRAWSFYTCVG